VDLGMSRIKPSMLDSDSTGAWPSRMLLLQRTLCRVVIPFNHVEASAGLTCLVKPVYA
jgi:hypothetical protein